MNRTIVALFEKIVKDTQKIPCKTSDKMISIRDRVTLGIFSKDFRPRSFSKAILRRGGRYRVCTQPAMQRLDLTSGNIVAML